MKGIGRGNHPNTHRLKGGKGKHPPKLNKHQKGELMKKVIGWIGDDVSKAEVKRLVIVNSPVRINDNDATAIIRDSLASLMEMSKQDAHLVIANHMQRYEKIYTYFKSINNAVGMNKAMRAKENLLRLHKTSNKVVVNQKNKLVVERKVEYDTSLLTPEEKKDLDELINIMKS